MQYERKLACPPDAVQEGLGRSAPRRSVRVALNQARLPFLVGLLLLSCYGFIQVLPRDAMLTRELTTLFQPDDNTASERLFAQLRVNDPLRGSLLPLPGERSATAVDSNGMPVPERDQRTRAILVLMIDSCSACVLPSLKLATDLQRRTPGLDVIAVSPSTAQELKRFRQTNDLKMRFVSDPGGILGRKYNAVWRPRAYLLSRTGALLWCQPGQWPEWQEAVDQAVQGARR